jgi:hypothetical protein
VRGARHGPMKLHRIIEVGALGTNTCYHSAHFSSLFLLDKKGSTNKIYTECLELKVSYAIL